jgi:hypothetical protein
MIPTVVGIVALYATAVNNKSPNYSKADSK